MHFLKEILAGNISRIQLEKYGCGYTKGHSGIEWAIGGVGCSEFDFLNSYLIWSAYANVNKGPFVQIKISAQKEFLCFSNI